MSDQIKITTVTASIAAQLIEVTRADGTLGPLKIYDLGNIPAAVNQDVCPVLRPRPRDFISNFAFTRDTFGADAARKSVTYVLTYQLLYAPVGQQNAPYEKYGDMINALVAVLLYFGTNSNNIAGATDVLQGPVPMVAGLPDSVSTSFHGGEIQLNIMQFMEA